MYAIHWSICSTGTLVSCWPAKRRRVQWRQYMEHWSVVSISTRSISGWMALILLIFKGVRERETREAILSPTRRSILSARSSPISRTVPMNMPPEPVTGFCILPRWATMSRIICPVLSRSPPQAS